MCCAIDRRAGFRPGHDQSLANPAALTAQAPAVYKAKFDTSKGAFVLEVHRDWAPHGADRFYNLVKNGFFDNGRFFRVISGFMVQFGINGDPGDRRAVATGANIPDDPVSKAMSRGYITFATGGPNTRTTQVFINYANNRSLDSQGFAPFGQVVSGMKVVDALYSGYGEGAPQGQGPEPGPRFRARGTPYLIKQFPKLDYIKKATITP